MATVAEEEAGVDGGKGDRRSRECGGDLESFGMKNEMTRDELLFIGSKLSVAVLNYSCC
jgi:hypothetical protein